jgi:hypothetical protein
VRLVLARVERERAYSRFRLDLLAEADASLRLDSPAGGA